MVSVVMAGMGNTAGAVIVTLLGGVGVAPRTRTLVPSGTTMSPLENVSGTHPCRKNEKGERAGGFTHHTEKGSG